MVRRIGFSASVLACLCVALVSACSDDDASSGGPPTIDGGLDTGSSPAPLDAKAPTSTDAGAEPDVVDSGAPVDANEASAPLAGIHVSLTGDDTADGSEAKPVKTLKQALQLVIDGQAIYLNDGVYDSTTQPKLDLTFTKSVTLIGTGSDKVTIAGAGATFIFNAGGGARGLTIKDLITGFSISGGTFTGSDLVFDHVSSPVIISGSTVATFAFSGTFLKNPSLGGLAAFLASDGTSDVTVTGGTVTGAATQTQVFLARGSSKLTVSGLTATSWGGPLVRIYDNGKVTVKDSTIDAVGPSGGSVVDKAVFPMGGQNTAQPLAESLALENTKVTNSSGSVVGLSLYGNMPSHDVISFTGSHLDNARNGVIVASPGNLDPTLTVTINATNTSFDGNTAYAIDSPRASITLNGGSMSTNTSGGIILRDAAATQSVKVRGTKLASNGGHAISINGAAGSIVDLGQTGDAGNVVFSGVPAGSSALDVQAPIAASAKGDTWMPNEQGSDASGKFAATVLSGPTSGKNATLVSGASVAVGP